MGARHPRCSAGCPRARRSYKRPALRGLASPRCWAPRGTATTGGPRAASSKTTDDAYVGGDVTPIAPHVAGFVAEILVTDNQCVQAGQPLIRLDAGRLPGRARSRRGRRCTREAGARQPARANACCSSPSSPQAEADLAAKQAQAVFAAEDASATAPGATAAGSRQDAERGAAGRPVGPTPPSWPPRPGWKPRSSSSPCSTPRSPRPRPPSRRPRPICTPRSSTSATPRSARRSTAMSATAPPRSAPT